jgi:hypothetical protein
VGKKLNRGKPTVRLAVRAIEGQQRDATTDQVKGSVKIGTKTFFASMLDYRRFEKLKAMVIGSE